jgi:uncharacterized protein (DUF1697 family)
VSRAAARPCVLLLRAINVGRRQLPMEALRELATQLGMAEPRTHLASGNLLARVRGGPAAAAKKLEAAISEHFGFHTDVIVREGAAWPQYLQDNPFAEASAAAPNRVMLLLSHAAPAADAVERLRERAAPGEQIAAAGDALWVHYADSIHASKLTPAFIDKCVGGPATGRNWRTVQALAQLLAAPAA